MKLLPIATALTLIAAPAFADETPAELFGRAHAAQGQSAAAQAMAVEKLSGNDIEDRILVVAPTQTTRNSAGHLQIAKSLGVSPDAYTNAQLAKLIIAEYD